MFSPSAFHDIVSGRRRGATASMLRAGLRIAEMPYSLAVRYRNLRYDRGHAEICHVPVPVISVGNLTLGGTGKTPMVSWLVDWCLRQRLRPAIISRGYGTTKGIKNDEALELASRFPNIPHIQNPDRVAAASIAIRQHAANVVIMDDGFQHRRLHRDFDIVLIDATQPYGFGHVFPRGSLREPLESIRRADVAILTRSDSISSTSKEELRAHYQSAAPELIWLESVCTATRLVNASNVELPLASLQGQSVVAFCAIGNPVAFKNTLTSLRCTPVQWLEFPDHHNFDTHDLASIEHSIRQSKANLVVCTCKDLVKLTTESLGDAAVFAVEITNNVEPVSILEQQLDELISRTTN